MAKQIRTHYDFGKVGELRNALWHVLSAAPASPAAGQFYYDSATQRFNGYNGAWKALAHEDEVVKLTGAQTVAGVKTFSSSPVLPSAAPTTDWQAAPKKYVDDSVAAAVSGLDVKASVRAATTANITLSGTQTVDGVALVAGDRVLVKDQSTASANGIYVVAAGAWSRSTDADTSAEVTAGLYVFVEEGTTNADSGWMLTTNGAITLGTTALTFTQFSGAGQITAGAGLTKSGNTLDVGGTANRITVNADSIDISSSYVGQSSITTVGTITSGTWSGTTIAVNKGGTGATDAAGARVNLGATGKATGLIGNGSATSIAFAHNLASQFVHVQVFDASTMELVDCDVVLTDANNVTLGFATAPATNAYRVVVVG